MCKQRRGRKERGAKERWGWVERGKYLRRCPPYHPHPSPSPSLSPPDLQASTYPQLRMSMPNSENCSTLENAMQLMIKTFHKYSGADGDKYTLSKSELKEMLITELANYLGNAQDKDAVDKVMGDLDSNNDGEVDFTEFVILVGALTVACNDFFLEYNEKQEKK
ncbi:protein S100-A1-like isoform X2 [Thalassophryne amazonica]|uniref:protein S100-A1-like isoform X2 n=1 Tax=Thalassophryne amazonica TaxID=390379 RepID=UPI00147234A3|nr:protein S100-A1-like isoform X2 [Thalassophryne amazonica]